MFDPLKVQIVVHFEFLQLKSFLESVRQNFLQFRRLKLNSFQIVGISELNHGKFLDCHIFDRQILNFVVIDEKSSRQLRQFCGIEFDFYQFFLVTKKVQSLRRINRVVGE
jgi:hypothetical protein